MISSRPKHFFIVVLTAGLLFGSCSKERTNEPADTVAPVVTIMNPKPNDAPGRESLLVELSASDNVGVVRIELLLNGTVVVTITSAPWRTTVSLQSLPDGIHTLQARAGDAAGNVGTSQTVSFLRGDPSDTQSPSVSIIAPAQNSASGLNELGVDLTASDNVGVTKIELLLNGESSPSTTITAEPWEAVLPISHLSDGVNTVVAKAYDGAGNVGTSQTVSFRKENVGMVLCEIITNDCPQCIASNEYYKTNITTAALKARLATVKVHVWWPLQDRMYQESQTWARPRTYYLFSPEAPTISPTGWVNGKNVGSQAPNWVTEIQSVRDFTPEAEIRLSKTEGAGSVNLEVRVKGLSTASYSDLRLHTIVTEDNILSDNIASYIHYDAMRTMIPDADGEAISLSNGETKTVQRTITIDGKWVKENLKVIVVLQSQGSKKVLQTARLTLK